MRADRLVATLLFLQSRGRVTAAEVAEELEVSIKTARRDLEALAIAGIPVYSQAGRGGGWSLIGGARTDLSGLTAAEARTLFMVAGPSSTATPEAKAALRKLVQALPERVRADAPTGDPVVRPAGFDLAATWDSVVASMEQRRTSQRARVRVPAVVHPGLRAQFGPTTTVVGELPDGRLEVEIGARTAGMI